MLSQRAQPLGPIQKTQPPEMVASGNIGKMVSENSVLVLGRRACCMCHVVKKLLLGLGVNPTVCELEEGAEAEEAEQALGRMGGGTQLPAVFIGGRLVGGLDRLMAAHISGELVPILKQAGALWL
ncbi:hypothetical protein AMTRI_Chr01g133470 [Amborella trichopoda]|uniref:Glutaredoxin domain-containing protein n=1 Tax=Amborella trichopoda TaxID=13333 RepID=W1Q0P8_AMBTC|nr:monothiol glutaredoxin-S3 [Amborella trichopoda]ERN14036.1 hypothetical protein AMTR_s00021p00206280 [Amborella trichopoda]|eukprot:XP_006852569.1 monothiol glutaredoxin-S3 [Amborella trichopoda]